MLPSRFKSWQTIYWWFRRFVRRLLFRTVHEVALMLDRENAEREASPTGGVTNSQAIKAPFATASEYHGGKKIVGRKRHADIDTDGRLLMLICLRPTCPTKPARNLSWPASAEGGDG